MHLYYNSFKNIFNGLSLLSFFKNALIQDLENCQKQLEEFHHTRVSKPATNQ